MRRAAVAVSILQRGDFPPRTVKARLRPTDFPSNNAGLTQETNMAEFDTVIKGGMVVDGTRSPRYRADVAIKNGVVAEIGFIDSNRAARVLDASGMVVAPGFVDLHTHYDAQLFWDPYCSISS